MDDADTATIELTEGEAREVINALSDYKPEVTGREETRALEVRDLLQREFGFEDSHFEGDGRFVPDFGNYLEWDGDDQVQLSRAEAAEVVTALADHETDAQPPEAETIADVRERFERTFDLEPDRRA